MDERAYVFTKDCLSTEHEIPFHVAARASIGVGGYAKAAFYPENLSKLILLIDEFKKHHQPFHVVGNMTNILPPDGRSEAVYLFTTKLKSVGMGRTVFAQAGVTSEELLDACVRHGKSGAEFLAGVPCTVGGAVYMNAGAGGKHIDDILESALVYHDGQIRVLKKEDCAYAYKESAFMRNGAIILGASFLLEDTDGESVEARRQAYLETRKRLPTGKSMGCVFKNPKDISAGKLIEGVGLKGFKFGGAYVSTEHANFVINGGNATAKDVRAVINVVKNAVLSQYGVILEEEIRYF
ncbi:MAG: UDP-N-acetylmuramate dehydrogenase [Clostridia bacterium]|nr:UDP-N-acetylmuramate dehydrogenase [Clostridia bacterium]